MKKNKIRSVASFSSNITNSEFKEDVYVPPMDILIVKILNLRLTGETPKHYAIKVTFFDQLLLTSIIRSTEAKDIVKETVIATGNMNYDPSDYEKMCLFADCPLIVNIQPLRSIECPSVPEAMSAPLDSTRSGSFLKQAIATDISCCNVDILPMFLHLDKMCIKKRMEPMVTPPVLQRKSWDNLPLLTMEISVVRNELNAEHHAILRKANHMKLTLIASYNMLIPYDDEYVYTAASKTPLHNETNTGLVTFNQGHRKKSKFICTSFYPKWETLRVGDIVFTKGDEKLVYDIEDIQNEHDIDLKYYMTEKVPSSYTTVWGSFHRTLMLEHSDTWLWNHLRTYHWPLEVHLYGEKSGYSFMSFLNLFQLLYPGETTVRLAVPLQWINAQAMYEKCGCDLLLTPNDKTTSTSGSVQKTSVPVTSKESAQTSNTTGDTGTSYGPTGHDGCPAFVIIEVKLARTLKKAVFPPRISNPEIQEMLKKLEGGSNKRECTGRGQLDRDWHSTVKMAVNALRKVPHYGMTEFCNFYRQLSETRTRVELVTSFWQDAAIYVNNNFIVQDFLYSDDTFEEMLMMAHACLVKETCQQLADVGEELKIDPVLRAARHARHMQDVEHAMELYMQVVIRTSRDHNTWRELSTCLMDIDKDWGNVCLTKSLEINPRHPLTLISKGCAVFDESPDAAEVFFEALLTLYPFWSTGLAIAIAYYTQRQLYHTADQLFQFIKNNRKESENSIDNIGFPRCWGRELGDWWEYTPLLPDTSIYCDAADLLLRLRAITLADVCVARALSEDGESAVYYHLLALCSRLRGDFNDALCHLRRGLEKFGEISYLRSLEAECLHKKNDIEGSKTSFEKSGNNINSYSILLSLSSRDPHRSRSVLVDLIRRQPSAYAWMALAYDWIKRTAVNEAGDIGATDEQAPAPAKECAAACAVQALKWDRRAGRAWALLSELVAPSSRRLHYMQMATACGYHWSDHHKEHSSAAQHSKQSLCHRLGKALRECQCTLCQD